MDFTYRAPFRSERLWRAHDLQRSVSYGATVALPVAFGLGPIRATVLVLLVLSATGAALYRLFASRKDLALRGALPDLVIAPMAAVLVSDSVLLALVAGTFIAATFLLVFQGVAGRVGTYWAVGQGLGVAMAVLAPLVEPIPPDGTRVAYGTVTVVLMVGVVALSLWLAVWWRLRSALDQREAELQVILDRTPVMLGTVGSDGALRSVLGDADGVFAGASLPEGMQALIRRFRGAPLSETVRVGERCFHVTCVPHGDDITFTMFDTTELEAATARLESVIRSKDEFIAAVSHELRTPLASVVGFSGLLLGTLERGSEAHATATIVSAQSQEMAAIIDDLLVAARADLGTLTIKPEPVELRALVAEVLTALGDRSPRQVDVSGLADASAIGDPVRVRQIVRNLCTNAARYGGSRVAVVTGSGEGRAWVEIRDDGPPIPPEVASAIFDPYVSAGADAGQPGAIGLGLSVSSGLADMMNGTLEYRHEAGWGIFRLELAAAPAPAPQAVDLGAGAAAT